MSDSSGFYELVVAPDTYLACALDDYCVDITVTGLEREDFEQFYGAAGWCTGACSDRDRPR